MRKLFKEGFFNRRCGMFDVLDFGKHARKMFMEVYFCNPGYCSRALSQQPKMDTLKDFKYFLRRAGHTEHKDKKEIG